MKRHLFPRNSIAKSMQAGNAADKRRKPRSTKSLPADEPAKKITDSAVVEQRRGRAIFARPFAFFKRGEVQQNPHSSTKIFNRSTVGRFKLIHRSP